SVVKQIKSHGHHATAIHPFNTSMYKRQEVYPKLGFDDFLYDKTMVNAERITSSSYISDDSAYKEVLRVMKETDEKDFIHLVTMQNHMPYGEKYASSPFRVTGSGNKREAEGYFNDLAHSDEAMKSLVEQLDEFDEEVVVVFWGDHLPGFYDERVQKRNADQAMYQTPLLIFSNRNEENK